MTTDSYKALSNYIDLLLDAICVVDKFGRFEFVSASAERIIANLMPMSRFAIVLPLP